jgi:D-alanyl-D-alanine carboxypeptidase (penicillin-binding protein 5/6)
MTDLGVLQEGRLRRSAREAQRRRERRRRQRRVALSVLGIGIVAMLAFMATGARDPVRSNRHPVTTAARQPPTPAPRAQHRGYTLTPTTNPLKIRFRHGLRSGLVFDVRSGRVLWQQDPSRALPIASLTKMMTALVVVARAHAEDPVLITRDAVDFSGSGVGLLPRGKRVSLTPLLYGLMLPSGNDAAIALAEHVAGTQQQFIDLMNARARAMGLGCSHFTTVSGIVDDGNYSCATDLAMIAHAVLEQPQLGPIVATRSAVLPFPIKGGKLFLYNNNPLLLTHYPGADGVKTGYTVAAGPCLVAAARRGREWYGVVLLHSDNPAGQAEKLLDAAFARGG